MDQPPREHPWMESEKVYLLAEMLKTAPLPSSVLYSIVRDHNLHLHPKWQDMPLPPGRSLRSCQHAFQEMVTTYSTPDYRPRPQLPTLLNYSGPQEIPKKRPHQPEPAAPIGRLLQPRPPHSYPGEYVPGPAYTIPQVGEQARPKKRGRPTKAEAQARADAAMARGEVYPPPRKAKSSLTAPELSSGQSPPGQLPPGQLPPGQAPHAPSPLGASSSAPPSTIAPTIPTTTTTPQLSTQAPEGAGTESTSSKKKRSKPSPLELEKTQRDPSETASPSVFGSATGDTSRTQAYSSAFTPISAPLPSANEARDRDIRMEGVEESQPRTTTPRSFKDTVGI